ncbi:MAG TPA: hypothetical protein PKW33_12570 [Anaerolineaceae bacterium]|nr:hypothetical protein [Anaerolineaceae bacterium]HPN52417.1 hypothetical protein [Anaerolineaceae bacterium]
MKIRPLVSFDDILAMEALVAANPSEHLHNIDLPYRLSSWALMEPRNVALWENETGKFVAWSVLQAPWWTIDFAFDKKENPGIFNEIVIWAEDRIQQVKGTPD